MKKSRPKIFVTGGTGMLGAHLLWHLLSQGQRVKALKRESSGLKELELIFKSYNDDLKNYESQIEWIPVDILDYANLEIALEGIEIVYHCAATVSFSLKPKRLLDVNIRGTQNIVYAALNAGTVKKFCFVSSIGAIGNPEKGMLADEETPWDENVRHSLYSESKYLSEKVVLDAAKKGFNVVIVNPGVIIGVASDSKNMKIFSIVNKGLPVYAKGGSGYVGVKDVCKIMIQLMNKPLRSQRYILVSENLSNKQLLDIIAKHMNKMPRFIKVSGNLLMIIAFFLEVFGKIFKTKPMIDRGSISVMLSKTFYSSEKIKKALDYEFQPIEKCVEEICDFLCKKG
jgi:nucleoside-diphosphate-sugar epimerase